MQLILFDIRAPLPEMAGRQRKLRAGQASGFFRLLFFELFNDFGNAGAGNVGNAAVAGLVCLAVFFQLFGNLHANALALAAVFQIQLHHRLHGGAGASEEVEDN